MRRFLRNTYTIRAHNNLKEIFRVCQFKPGHETGLALLSLGLSFVRVSGNSCELCELYFDTLIETLVWSVWRSISVRKPSFLVQFVTKSTRILLEREGGGGKKLALEPPRRGWAVIISPKEPH